MLDLKLHFHQSCPKHPCYHPREGRGAIKGGCVFCEALCKINQAGNKVIEAVTEFQELSDRYEAKQIRSAPKESVSSQPTLFPLAMEARRR
jgi:radical SAM superfamily enzyme